MFAGVYENWGAASQRICAATNPFDGQVWTETVRSAAIQARNDFDNPDSACEWYEREFLTLLSMQLASKGHVHVLDFGGGPASTFFSIAGKLPAGDLRYDIVDTPTNCEIGRELAAKVEGLRFV